MRKQTYQVQLTTNCKPIGLLEPRVCEENKLELELEEKNDFLLQLKEQQLWKAAEEQ